MSQDNSKEGSQVELRKSEEELTELLEKFEKNIVGSILDQDQDLMEEVIEASKVPNFLSTDFEERRWEYLNPIVLYKNNWMGARTEGISLEKGSYKIEYRVTSTTSKGTGLALFKKDTKKVEKLLFWQIGDEKSESIINVSGTQYLTIYSSGIINITDIRGNFNPEGVESIYIVTVFRKNILPD